MLPELETLLRLQDRDQAIRKITKLMERIPQDEANKKKILAHTKLLGPGEEDSVIFTAPSPGKYEYLCTFPGHFGIMRGVLTVKPK